MVDLERLVNLKQTARLYKRKYYIFKYVELQVYVRIVNNYKIQWLGILVSYNTIPLTMKFYLK